MASSLLATYVVKSETSEGVFVINVEEIFPGELKEKVATPTSANTLSSIIVLFCNT